MLDEHHPDCSAPVSMMENTELAEADNQLILQDTMYVLVHGGQDCSELQEAVLIWEWCLVYPGDFILWRNPS